MTAPGWQDSMDRYLRALVAWGDRDRANPVPADFEAAREELAALDDLIGLLRANRDLLAREIALHEAMAARKGGAP
jgi:hypothetical protein